ncbi:hypothetical protein ACFL4T_14795 [candidate division KSB1 bacterium]
MTTEILMRFVAVIAAGLVVKWMMMRVKNRRFSRFKGYLSLFSDAFKILRKHKWIFFVSIFVALPAKLYDNLINAFVESNYRQGVEDFYKITLNLKWEIVRNVNNWYSSFNEIITANPLPALRFNFISIALMLSIYFFSVKGRLERVGQKSSGSDQIFRVFYPTFSISLFAIIYYLSPFYYEYLLGEAGFNLKYWLIYILPSSYLILISGVVFSVILFVAAKAFFFTNKTTAEDYLVVFVNNFGKLFMLFFLIFCLSIFYSLFQGEVLYPAKINETGVFLFNFLYSGFIWMLIFTPFIIMDEGDRVFASMEKSLKFWAGHIPEILVYFVLSFIVLFLLNLLSSVIKIEGLGTEFLIIENLISLSVIFIQVVVKCLFAVGAALLFVNLKYQKEKHKKFPEIIYKDN